MPNSPYDGAVLFARAIIPNYFEFSKWLILAMKDDPLGNGHFHADGVFRNNMLDVDYEAYPTTVILSFGMTVLEYAHKFFQKRAFSSKIPVFVCDLNDLENYDPDNFEHDDSIPDFSTLEKTAAWLPEIDRSIQIFYYVIRPGEWQECTHDRHKFICIPAPAWFGSEYKMIYRKKLLNFGDPPRDSMFHGCTGFEVFHDITFYHRDAKDCFPFEMNQWYRYVSLPNSPYPKDDRSTKNDDPEIYLEVK